MIEVKAGYKQTEVGVIPEDWEVKLIEEISNPVRGGSPRPAGSPKYFNGDYIPWLTVASLTNISPMQIFVCETESYLTKEGSHHSRTLEKDTLIIANSGATLGVAKLLSIKCCANDGIAALLDFNNKIDKHFVVHYINSLTKRLREVVATGNGQPNLNTDLIGQIQIPLPKDKSEQTAIATVLSDTDALIEHLEKLIAKKKAIKQGTMQQLLTGKKRLPGFEKNEGYKQTELGVIPEDWDVKEINIDIDLLTGYPFPSNQYSSNGIKLLRGSNIKRGVTDWSEEITQYWEKITPELRFYILSVGDIVIAMDGSLVGRSFARLSRKDLPALLLQRVARIRSSKIDMGFLKEFICSEYFSKYCDSVKTSSAIPHISPIDIRNFKIPLPPIKIEQAAIATILSDMDSEIEALEQTRDKYTMIKQGMMQQLLTGRIRIHGTN